MCPMLDDRNDTPVGAPDGRAADVEPAGQRGRLDGAARRRPRRSRRLAVRRAGPGRRTSPGCRRRSSTSGRRTRFRDEDVDYATPDLAGRRGRRAARLARRLPRLRRDRPARGISRPPSPPGQLARRPAGVDCDPARAQTARASSRTGRQRARRVLPSYRSTRKDSHATHPVQRRLGDPAARQLLRRDGRRRGAVAAGDAAARRRARPRPRRLRTAPAPATSPAASTSTGRRSPRPRSTATSGCCWSSRASTAPRWST